MPKRIKQQTHTVIERLWQKLPPINFSCMPFNYTWTLVIASHYARFMFQLNIVNYCFATTRNHNNRAVVTFDRIFSGNHSWNIYEWDEIKKKKRALAKPQQAADNVEINGSRRTESAVIAHSIGFTSEFGPEPSQPEQSWQMPMYSISNKSFCNCGSSVCVQLQFAICNLDLLNEFFASSYIMRAWLKSVRSHWMRNQFWLCEFRFYSCDFIY